MKNTKSKSIFMSNNILSYLIYNTIAKEYDDGELELFYTSDPKSKKIYISKDRNLTKNNLKTLFKILTMIVSSWFKKINNVYIGYPTLFTVIFVKFANYTNLIYIDDGTTFLECIDNEDTIYIREIKKSKLKIFLYSLINVNKDSMILSKIKRLNKLVVFYPQLFKSKYSEYLIEDATNYVPNKEEIEKILSINYQVKQNSILIVTQPFLEYGLNQFGDIMEDINNLIRINSESSIYIKPHPRENVDKYSIFKGKINILEKHIPSEYLILTDAFKKIYGYYSASLFNIKTHDNTKVISLLKINENSTNNEYYNKIKHLKKFKNNLYFIGEEE